MFKDTKSLSLVPSAISLVVVVVVEITLLTSILSGVTWTVAYIVSFVLKEWSESPGSRKSTGSEFHMADEA